MRRRWIIAAITIVISLVSIYRGYSLRPVYQASALVHIERERDSGFNNQNAGLIEKRDDYYQTQYKLLTSYSLIERLYARLGLDKDPEFKNPDGVLKLQAAASVQPVLGTRLVYLNVDSFTPQRAMEIANALAQLFVEQNLENQLFISQEVLKALQTGPAGGRQAYESLPAVVNNKLIQELKSQEALLQTKIGDYSQRYTERHPEVLALRSTHELLKARIDTEVDRVVSSLKTELSGQLKGNNARVIDLARLPRNPVRPNKRLYVTGGLLGGFMLGILAAFLLELADQTIRTQEQVEKSLHLPFLALIPFSSQKENSKPFADIQAPTPSLSSEAFRNMRTMVDFANLSSDSAPMLVTSTVQEEGKSFVSSNLSVAYSQLHPRILLIDGDLRRPSLHRKFQIPNERGLSNFLASGENLVELDSLLQSPNIPNLKVLPSGPRPPNPSELLNTPKVAALLSWATKHFDRVIVDCPPIFPISDTILWGRHVKHAIFVVRFGKTRIPIMRDATRRLSVSGIKTLGVVINAAVHSGLSYSYYNQYYYQYYKSYHEEEVTS